MDDREWLMDRRFAGMNLGLERIESLLHKLDNPQSDFPSIHVAGTNGKGTLCAFLSSAAANTGVRVGLFTTPHLVVVEERVRIDGEVIDTTVGRLIFNEVLPEEIGFINRTVDKSDIKKITSDVHRLLGNRRTAEFVDTLKKMGYH